MYRAILIFTILLFSNFGYTFEPEVPNFEDIDRVCYTQPDPTYLDLCNQYGFNYELLNTSLYTEVGEEINFNTEVVLIGNSPSKQVNKDFSIICYECDASTQINAVFLTQLSEKLETTFKMASQTVAFSTKKVKKNNRPLYEPDIQNNGETFSESFKNFGAGLKDFKEVYESVFQNDEAASMLILTDQEGKALGIVKYDGVEMVLVANLMTPITSSGNSITFSGSMSAGDLPSYLGAIGSLKNNGMDCTTTYTGSGSNLVSQTTCWF